MNVRCFRVEKLIRDKIPALLESKGISVHTKILEDQEFISRLKDKLVEEAKEVLEASNSNEICEELADVMELVQTLSKACGLSIEQIEQRRLEKRETKGGFEHQIYNSSVEIQENNPSITIYLNKPQQYPEIESYTY